MWAIQLIDGKRSLIYLREYILDGRIVVFDKEEAALRYMNTIKVKIESLLGVRLCTVRYCGDPRKDKPYRVPDCSIESLLDYMYSLMH